MNQNPVGRRRGGLRLWVRGLFGLYAAWYWYSNRSVDPLTGTTVVIDRSISPEQEKTLGLQAYREVLQQEHPLPADAQESVRVRNVADRLIAVIPEVSDALAAEHGMQASHIEKTFDWAVSVLQSDQVNAFCLPGGKMAVYTGLLPVAQNDDAIAVVMGHEISHALLRHGAQRMTRGKLEQLGQVAGAASGMDQGTLRTVMSAYGFGSALPYARSQETQADELGLMLAAAACFDPQQAIPLWQRMDSNTAGQAPPEFASTHPSAGTRIHDLESLMPKAEQYRQRFCKSAGGPAAQAH